MASVLSAATLEWLPVDYPEQLQYRVYRGLDSGSYDFAVDVGTNLSWTLADTEPGNTFYYAVTAYTVDGVESDFSAESGYAVPAMFPPGVRTFELHFQTTVNVDVEQADFVEGPWLFYKNVPQGRLVVIPAEETGLKFFREKALTEN